MSDENKAVTREEFEALQQQNQKLQSQLDELSKLGIPSDVTREEFDALKTQNQELKDQLASSFTTSDVTREEFEALQLQNQEMKSQLAELAGAGEKEEAISEPKVLRIPEKTFKMGKKEYRFLVPHFIIPGIGYRTAEEALVDKNAQAALVAAGEGVIREVV